MAAGRVRGTMTERKAASAGDRWNSRPLALSRFRSRSFSLRLRRIYSRSRARAHTRTRFSRARISRRPGLSLFRYCKLTFTLRVPHPWPRPRTFGSSPSSFLQIVGPKRFDTVFGGCFNRSFKRSLWTLSSSFPLPFSLPFFLSIAFSFLLFSWLRQCAIFVAPLYWKILAHLQLETINKRFLTFLKFIKTWRLTPLLRDVY